jgi:LysR family glycine cleavage system transcriptional activator
MQGDIMARNLPLRRLDTFCVVARHLSIKNAANDLCVTASAVSHQIKALEKRLGVPLFVRDPRLLSLTAAGRGLFQEIDPLIRNIESSVKRYSRSKEAVPLLIRLPALFATELFMPRFKAFADCRPRIEFRVETTESDRYSRQSGVDVAVVMAGRRPAGRNIEPLFGMRLVPAASPETAKRLPYGLARLPPGVKLIVHKDRPRAWEQWTKAAGIEYVPPGGVIHLDSSAGVASAAEKGLGVALVPFPLLAARFEAGTLVRLADQTLDTRDRYYLVYEPDDENEEALQALVAWILAEFGECGKLAANTRSLRSPSSTPEFRAAPN